jgi:hypothetical protein
MRDSEVLAVVLRLHQSLATALAGPIPIASSHDPMTVGTIQWRREEFSWRARYFVSFVQASFW